MEVIIEVKLFVDELTLLSSDKIKQGWQETIRREVTRNVACAIDVRDRVLKAKLIRCQNEDGYRCR